RVFEVIWRRRLAVTGAELLDETASVTPLPLLACALADGLHAAKLASRGAEAVAVEPDGTGAYRVHLDGVSPKESELFATALDELIAPVTTPRYLIPRYLVTAEGPEAGLRLYDVPPPANAVVHHAVPTVLGENRKRVDRFTEAWRRWVCDARPVYTRSPEGAGVLAAQTGASPMDVTTVLRAGWA
ncbi:hypothetical protein P8605_48845, partial [Streptomyces sp. T-3]|nr:hypothetical protein [Streptomyces sp. T-3]